MKKSRKVRRLLYRRHLTNDEVDRLIALIGLRRMLRQAAALRRAGLA